MKKTNIFGLVLILSTLLIGCAQPNMCADIPEVYTITAAETINGTISLSKTTAVAGETTAVAGETITVTATPTSGYSLASISAGENITLTGNGNEKTFTMPASNVTITAIFAQLYTVDISGMPSNWGITYSCQNNKAFEGERVIISIPSNVQSAISSIIVYKETEVVTVNNNSFIMPMGDVNITIALKEDKDVEYYEIEHQDEPLSIIAANSSSSRYISLNELGCNTYTDLFTKSVYGIYNPESSEDITTSGLYLSIEGIAGVPGLSEYKPNNIIYDTNNNKIKVYIIREVNE